MIWCCPNCGASFLQGDRSWRCANGHSFDLAKQGYLNLLLANQKHSADPGDNKAMVVGRRRFLEQGHYLPLVEALANLLTSELPNDCPASAEVLDMGCGEGYYLAQLEPRLKHLFAQPLSLNGVDISREAIKRAAQRLGGHQFCVASSYRMPVIDNSVDIALQVFAPVSEQEVQRVLKPAGSNWRGLWLRVSPGPRHLYELKSALYEQVREHTAPEVPEGFTLLSDKRVGFSLSLETPEAIEDLLTMTPFAWRGASAGREALVERGQLETTADFVIQLLIPEARDAHS